MAKVELDRKAAGLSLSHLVRLRIATVTAVTISKLRRCTKSGF